MSFCAHCGNKNSPRGKYCAACGRPTAPPAGYAPAPRRGKPVKNPLPVLFAIAIALLLIAAGSIVYLFAAGIPGSISAAELEELGFECRPADLSDIAWLPSESASDDALDDIKTQRCSVRGRDYNLYSNSDFSRLYSARARAEACPDASFLNEEPLEEFAAAFGEFADDNMLRAQQYIFDAGTINGRQALEELLDDAGVDFTTPSSGIHRPDCEPLYF